MQYEKIFDQDFINQLPALDKFSNPNVVALCQRGEISLEVHRAQIEKWFQNLPDDQKLDIYGRLHSLDDRQHLSAFYELLFHQYCLEEGWSIQKHPSINGQNPDFLVDVPIQGPFFLEVATLMDEEGLRRNEERFNKLLRKLDAIKTDFSVSVYLREWPSENINYDAIVRKVKDWLKTLKQEEKACYEIKISDFGFNGSIDASYNPENKPKSGSIFVWSSLEGTVDPAIKVKTAISEKVKKYKFAKTSGKPFVIALCSSNNFSIDEWAIDKALYGRTVVSWKINNPKSETKVHRDYSGLVTPNPGLLGEPRNTRISAVIFCSKVWNGERMLYNMRVFHNPWAIIKLPLGIFEKCQQLSKTEKKPGYMTLEWHNDNKQYIIFE